MNERELAVYEDARMLASNAVWTVELQIRRLTSRKLEIEDFVMQPFVDFHFLLIALGRLENAAKLAGTVVDLSTEIHEFQSQLPWLRKLRNTMEHINDYQLAQGRDKSVRIGELHVFGDFQGGMTWLGEEVNYDLALQSSQTLFDAIRTK